MLILIDATCFDCGAKLTEYTGNMVIQWKEEPTRPAIFIRCKNRALCAERQATK